MRTGMLVPSILFCLTAYASSSSSKSSRELVEGAPIKLSGVVKLVQWGNNSYLVIRPNSPYEAVFDASDRRTVREIGLSLAGQWEALRSVLGKKVFVSGKVQLEPVSPYYLNGTLILADSIRLTDGVELKPKQYTARGVPAAVSKFRAVVTFTPREWQQFRYEAWDGDGHRLPSSFGYLACRLNGPGDVMNCFCAEGFAFTGKAEMKGGDFSKLEAPEPDFDFAQFVIADPVRHWVREEVECTRKPVK